MSNKVKLKGHESFSIREGWLTKGIIEVKNNDKIFSEKNATDILGMGTNMVKSLKFWLTTSNLIVEDKKCSYKLSELGELIYKYDLYLEDIFSLYLIHNEIVKNSEKAVVWNYFFYKSNLREFNKRELLEQLEYLFDAEKLEYNEKMLIDDINILLKTYANDEKNENPEINFTCPLTELNLIKKINKDKYQRINSNVDKLNVLIFYYCLLEQCNEKTSISIDELIKSDNGIARTLNLSKNEINYYLEILKKEKYITVNKTAGLNMIYIHEKLNLKDIFEKYFEGEKKSEV